VTSRSIPEAAQRRPLLLAAVLFISYQCVGMSLPVAPVFLTGRLGLTKAWAGLGVGIAFLATIVTRGHAGSLSDRRGAKVAVARGLGFYIAGALTSLALVGAAIYGALAVGGPIGLLLLDRLGFAGTTAIGALLPCLGLLAIWRIAGVAAHPGAARPSFLSVIGSIRWHGAVVCLQGIGFAAIGAFFTLYFRGQHWPYAGLGLTAFGAGFVLVRVFFGHLPDRIGGLPVAVGSLAMVIGLVRVRARNADFGGGWRSE
jgi:hypothetical protein